MQVRVIYCSDRSPYCRILNRRNGHITGTQTRVAFLTSGFALFPGRHKHVVLQPPCGSEVSWMLPGTRGSAPQGGRPCSLHPASIRSYCSSAPSSPPPASPPSSTSPPGGASPTATATSPS